VVKVDAKSQIDKYLSMEGVANIYMYIGQVHTFFLVNGTVHTLIHIPYNVDKDLLCHWLKTIC
jgi:hypothetical protein